MIYGIVIVKECDVLLGDAEEIWIGTLNWNEPLPINAPKYRFATTDINKAYQWLEELHKLHPKCKYVVKEMKLQ